ncbi:MAG: hypothetical protein M2R46_05161 [Verrucomicrobia subdivision 3 bacterium]|nr:hypothetical protein [Limisphaerales bacterium]
MGFAVLVDWFIGWLHPAGRWTMTLPTLMLGAAGFMLWLVLPVLRRLDAIGAAQNIEQQISQMKER